MNENDNSEDITDKKSKDNAINSLDISESNSIEDAISNNKSDDNISSNDSNGIMPIIGDDITGSETVNQTGAVTEPSSIGVTGEVDGNGEKSETVSPGTATDSSGNPVDINPSDLTGLPSEQPDGSKSEKTEGTTTESVKDVTSEPSVDGETLTAATIKISGKALKFGKPCEGLTFELVRPAYDEISTGGPQIKGLTVNKDTIDLSKYANGNGFGYYIWQSSSDANFTIRVGHDAGVTTNFYVVTGEVTTCDEISDPAIPTGSEYDECNVMVKANKSALLDIKLTDSSGKSNIWSLILSTSIAPAPPQVCTNVEASQSGGLNTEVNTSKKGNSEITKP